MTALRFLGALKKDLFLAGTLNGKATKTVMVDLGTTHNFITVREAKRLGFKLEKDVGKMKVVGKMKAINSQARAITRLVK